jgi:L-amino acid N-acyltransferase YncA
MIVYTLAKSKEDFHGILHLQKKNFKTELASSEMLEEGFLSLTHELPELEMISGKYSHVIAKEKDQVIGYALVMLREFQDVVPVLVPMFEQLVNVKIDGKAVMGSPFFLMGQICIDKNSRGKGVFKGLYRMLKEMMSAEFKYVVTEVATRNTRSMNAHQATGFKSLLKYTSPEMEEWDLVYWDWR